MHSISKHVRHCVVIYLFSVHAPQFQSAFSRQMTAGAITALTFRKLKQITIKESWGVGRTRCIARFPCDNTVLVITYTYNES